MRIFVSVGEPSGDVHGANLIRALRERRPDVEVVGFGGERMQAAGATLLYPLVNLAVMWFARVLANLGTFVRLVGQADRYFEEHRPDAVVLIDYPGFNWWIAKKAHARGIPVYYFVPPQLWGWAGWRVKKMRRTVDHVLCSLPFEVDWYAQRGVTAHYLAHPYFDELPKQTLDETFLADQRARGGDVVALLPGSRNQEVERNLDTLLAAAKAIRANCPQARFLVASFKPHQQAKVDAVLRTMPDLPIETHVGRTPEILALARACVAVSGSVSLEMLYREVPSSIVYRVGKMSLAIARPFIKARFICLVNLLAGKELFPEHLTDRCPAPQIAAEVTRWLTDPAAEASIRAELAALRADVAAPGACGRVADYLLATLATPIRRAA